MGDSLLQLSTEIISKARQMPAENSFLVGISGIDAGGKGFIARQVATQLEAAEFRVALINVDGWLNLPQLRFSKDDPGRHFYDNALRLDEMFERLVLPLKTDRSINVTVDFAEETATDYRPHRYDFNNIDVILLEGIFLFKRKYVQHFELKVWIECSFDTALQRAISRQQEGLNRDETIAAYKTIYFPAQRYHFQMDEPRVAADVVFMNDEVSRAGAVLPTGKPNVFAGLPADDVDH